MREFNLETHAWEGEDEPITSLGYLQSICRDENRPDSMRIRSAVEALPYENPRVSAVAVSHMNGNDFASALERAILRSKSPLPLPAPNTIEHDPGEMKGPMQRLYRRY